jgi:hypothetical protein
VDRPNAGVSIFNEGSARKSIKAPAGFENGDTIAALNGDDVKITFRERDSNREQSLWIDRTGTTQSTRDVSEPALVHARTETFDEGYHKSVLKLSRSARHSEVEIARADVARLPGDAVWVGDHYLVAYAMPSDKGNDIRITSVVCAK